MADFRTVLERFRTDLTSRDAKIDDCKVSSIGVYLLLNAHLFCIVQNEKTLQNQKLNLVQWIVVLPRMGRIYVLCVAGHKTKTAKTLSCGFYSTTDWTPQALLCLEGTTMSNRGHRPRYR